MTKNQILSYYHSLESRLGYRYLKGVKHFGYYPEGKEGISKFDAQMLMNEHLAQNLSLPTGSRLLDAGCGEGNVALYLAEKHGYKVDGIDLLDFNIEKAQMSQKDRALNQDTSFRVGSYMELPFGNKSFDGVYTMETLVHAPDYQGALKEFYRVLKPGGRLVNFEYSIKPADSLNSKEAQAMMKLKQVNHVAYMPAFNDFTFGSLPEKWQNAGFSEVEIEDITERIMPMLKKFYKKARLPYALLRQMNLENHVINAMSAVEFYENQGLWRYVIISAVKPTI